MPAPPAPRPPHPTAAAPTGPACRRPHAWPTAPAPAGPTCLSSPSTTAPTACLCCLPLPMNHGGVGGLGKPRLPCPAEPACRRVATSSSCLTLEHRSRQSDDRRAMYDGWRSDGAHSKEWAQITNAFLNHAFAGPARVVLYPCCLCVNHDYHHKEQVKEHLCKYGFMPNYMVWNKHGEGRERPIERDNNNNNPDRMHEMLNDLGRQFDVGLEAEKRSLSKEVEEFYRLLAVADEIVHESTKVIVLETVTRLMSMKAKFNYSNECYNFIVKLIDDILPPNHKMPKDMYQSKKNGLGMNYQKIDVCENNCLLFRKNGDEKLSHCKRCGNSRYVEVLNEEGESVTTTVPVKQLRRMPMTERFKQLYLSKETAHPMRWSKEGERKHDDDIMTHPSDGEAWHALDRFDL
ncbi:LOW QUALITY PROTEIN: hypothetical protein U9M48_003183 [Paspalum notatum var. saurae]|uniref:Transposase-associated domain-containing protein n=1 Tax=Paspalum notatum var. saurae TaxID=547442 RepID=A0AAQ3PL23_PASNO